MRVPRGSSPHTYEDRSSRESTQKPSQTNINKGQNITLAHLTTNEMDECVLCKQSHRIHACKIFKELLVELRRNEAKRLNLCYNCLSSNHMLQKCTSRNCKHCAKRHQTLLHTSERSNSSSQNASSSNDATADSKDVKSNTQECIKPGTTSVTMKYKL